MVAARVSEMSIVIRSHPTMPRYGYVTTGATCR
jgi:hypothetical protein